VRGDQADRYLHEMAAIAERLGAERIPRTRVALRGYFRACGPSSTRASSAWTRCASSPRRCPEHQPVLSGAHQVVIQAAIGLLPGWARDMLGLRLPSLARRRWSGPPRWPSWGRCG
jgi:uncharacterized protein (DUF2236 family)